MSAKNQQPVNASLEMTVLSKGKKKHVTSEMIKAVLAKLAEGNRGQLALSA